PQRRGFLDGLQDLRMRMAGEKRPPGEHVVDVGVAVLVVQAGALALLDKKRFAAHSAKSADGRVHAAREQRLCALEFALRLFDLQGRHGGQGLGPLPVTVKRRASVKGPASAGRLWGAVGLGAAPRTWWGC